MKKGRLLLTVITTMSLFLSLTSFAMTPLTLIINNQTKHIMSLINSKLTRMNVEPEFSDFISPNSTASYILQFDDRLAEIINDSAEINYGVQCSDGTRDKVTITAAGKVNQLKIISYSITIDKKVSGISEDGSEGPAHCVSLLDHTSPIEIRDGLAEIVLVPIDKK